MEKEKFKEGQSEEGNSNSRIEDNNCLPFVRKERNLFIERLGGSPDAFYRKYYARKKQSQPKVSDEIPGILNECYILRESGEVQFKLLIQKLFPSSEKQQQRLEYLLSRHPSQIKSEEDQDLILRLWEFINPHLGLNDKSKNIQKKRLRFNKVRVNSLALKSKFEDMLDGRSIDGIKLEKKVDIMRLLVKKGIRAVVRQNDPLKRADSIVLGKTKQLYRYEVEIVKELLGTDRFVIEGEG